MNRIFKRIWNVFTTVLVAVTVLLAIALAGVRLVGYTPYAVLSPSMTPAYNVGDLIYVRQTAFSEIEVGDAISFVANEQLTVVTHRVVEIDDENQCFRTKGDANDVTDAAPVLYPNVLGVVKFSLPGLGYVSSYLTSASGRYVAVAVIAALLLVLLLPEFFKKDPKKSCDNAE